MQHILQKIRIAVSESTAHIVILITARFDKFQKFRNDHIIASAPCIVNPRRIVDFLSAVKTEDNVAHLTV